MTIQLADAPVRALLDRLEYVTEDRKGTSWRAKCPVHGGNTRNSLSITVADDGKVLLTCFGGCAVHEIVKVCGMEMSDLFPQRITHNATKEERRHLRDLALRSQIKAAAAALEHEARVVAIAAEQIARGEPLDKASMDRLYLAVDRADGARRHFHAF